MPVLIRQHSTGQIFKGPGCTIKAAVFPLSGSLTIIKQAAVEDGTDFAFTSDIPGGSRFSLDDEASQTNVINQSSFFADIAMGSYTISEMVPTNWQLDSASCSGGADSGSLSGDTLTVSLAAEEAIPRPFANHFEDGDGIVAAEEDNVPGYNGSAQGDGNGDSIADRLQATVSFVQDSGSGCWWTMESDGLPHSNVLIEAPPVDTARGLSLQLRQF